MKIILIVQLLVSLPLLAKFEVGDLLLVSYRPCYICQVIESESGFPYSHIGLVIKKEREQVYVADSLGSVRMQKLEEFTHRANIVDHYRILDFEKWDRIELQSKFLTHYYAHYDGLPYDDEFLWENYDKKGLEKLYCSEFLTKFLEPFLDRPFTIHPMNYTKHMKHWINYFRPYHVPQGLKGNNPGLITSNDNVVLVE